MKRTIVIGNGFDLDFGFKTSYADFIESTQFKRLLNLNILCKHLYETYKKCNWVDIEIELAKYPKQKDGGQFYREYTELRNALKSYLKSITMFLSKEKPAYIFLEQILNDCGKNRYKTIILNFNYTKTVTNIIENYKKEHGITKISDLQIRNIHGQLDDDIDNDMNEIVFGYNGENYDIKNRPFLSKTAWNGYRNMLDIFDTNELYIFGHSLGESDENFFKPFFNSITGRNRIILLYHFEEGELKKLSGRIYTMLNEDNKDMIKQVQNRCTSKKDESTNKGQTLKSPIYSIAIHANLATYKGILGHIGITERDTVQSILDKIYFLLDGRVKPYTYMDSWVLKEMDCGAYMIMYEVTSLVPAKYIFKPELKWEVVKWDNRYKTVKSKFFGGISVE